MANDEWKMESLVVLTANEPVPGVYSPGKRDRSVAVAPALRWFHSPVNAMAGKAGASRGSAGIA